MRRWRKLVLIGHASAAQSIPWRRERSRDRNGARTAVRQTGCRADPSDRGQEAARSGLIPRQRQRHSSCCTRALAGGITAILATIGLAAHAADPSALWHIVHDRCVPDEQERNDPAPCTEISTAQGYAVLKDIVGETQFLLIPTERLTGIADPAILAPGEPNYWDAAWQARRYVSERAGHDLPRDAIALAINSEHAISQNQLHIHIDCIRPDVRDALQRNQSAIQTKWTDFPVPLAGHRFRALRVDQADLSNTDPFRLLAEDVPSQEMGEHTLVLTGATFPGGQLGFVLLDDRADLAAGDRASGELLQDHACMLAH